MPLFPSRPAFPLAQTIAGFVFCLSLPQLATATTPAAPANLSASLTIPLASPASGNEAYYDYVLRWQDRSDTEHGFEIFARVGRTASFVLLGKVGPNVTQATSRLPRFDALNPLQFRVRAFRDRAFSAFTNTVEVPIPVEPNFVEPSSLSVAHGPRDSTVLTWVDNSELEDFFVIETKKSSATAWEFYGLQTFNVPEFTLNSGLEPGGTYDFRVRALRLAAGASLAINPSTKALAHDRFKTGQFTSQAVVNGNPAISYYDLANGNLMYLRASNPAGTDWSAVPITVDSTGDVGTFTSMQLIDGVPAISYRDGSNGRLKFVRATDTNGSAWDTPKIVDSSANVGAFSSLATINGHPAISYSDSSTGALKFARSANAIGSIWSTPVTVDTAGAGALYTSLAVVNGRPAVSYYKSQTGDLAFAIASDASGTSWNSPVTVASTGNVGAYTTLLVVNGNPAISYYDLTNADLKYVRASSANGNSWASPVTVDSTGAVGAFASMAIVNGNPAISYYDETNRTLKFARASDVSGLNWSTRVVADRTANTGSHTSLAIVNGNPAISYYYSTNADLRWIRSSDANGLIWNAFVDVEQTYAVTAPLVFSLAATVSNFTIRDLNSPPSQIRGVAVDENTIRLHWIDESDKEQGYDIQFREGTATSFTTQSYTAPNATSFEIDTPPKATVTWRVRGAYLLENDTIVTSPASSEVTVSTPFFAPSNVSAAYNVDTNALILTWTDNSKVESGYQVGLRPLGSTASYELATSVGANATTATLSGLAPGAALEVIVVAYFNNGTGSEILSDFSTPVVVYTSNGFTSPLSRLLSVGTAFSYQLATTTTVPRLSWSVEALPPGLSFNAVNGEISGTPTTQGVFPVPLRATFADGSIAQSILTLSVRTGRSAVPPIAPRSTPAGNRSIAPGFQVAIPLTSMFSDPDTETAVRLSTSVGNIDLLLFSSVTPQSVANFLSYVDGGDYNGVAFHRSIPGFVIQGGAYKPVQAPDKFQTIVKRPSPLNEPFISNLAKTVAMAKLGGNPNSASSEFFFNLSDTNAANLDAQNGGFTAFARVSDSTWGVVESLAQKPASPYDHQLDDITTSAVSYTPVAANNDFPWPMNPQEGDTNYPAAPPQMDTARTVVITSASRIQNVLTYTVTSSNPSGVGASISNGNLLISGVASGAESDITVEATDLDGLKVSQTFRVQVVQAPPTITQSPSDLSRGYGFPATFTVKVDGTGPFKFEWFRGTSSVSVVTNSGSNSSSYTIPATNISHEGQYRVVVTNSAGVATSAWAKLTVLPTDRDGNGTLDLRDSDSDGFDDGTEIAFGSNPQLGNSRPVSVFAARANATATLENLAFRSIPATPNSTAFQHSLTNSSAEVPASWIAAHEMSNSAFASILQVAYDRGLIQIGTGPRPIVTYQGMPVCQLPTHTSTEPGNLKVNEISFDPRGGFFVPIQAANHPVRGISWYGAYLSTVVMNLTRGYPAKAVPATWSYTAGEGYFIPSDALWEWAAKSGIANRIYPTGPTVNASLANFAPAALTPRPVTSYAANAFGVFNLAGNVEEWVFDPTGVSDASAFTRGGSWLSTESALRNNQPNNQRTTRTKSSTDLPTGIRIALKDSRPPSFTTSPRHQLGSTSAPLSFTAEITGAPRLTGQWFKAGRRLTGRTSPILSFPSPKLSDAGTYRLRITNPLTSADSSDVQALLIDAPLTPQAVSAGLGKPVTFRIPYAGQGLLFKWKKGETELFDGSTYDISANNATAATGSSTLTVLSPTYDSAGRYTCTISTSPSLSPQPPPLTVIFDLTVTAPPVLEEALLPNTILNAAYDFNVPFDPHPLRKPISMTISGLPPGMAFNQTTGKISGKPTRSGTFVLFVTGTTLSGSSTAVYSLIVQSLNPRTVGDFTALISRDPETNGNLGGRVDLKTTSTGAYSGTLVLGRNTYRFSGVLDATINFNQGSTFGGNASFNKVITGPGLPTVELALVLNETDNLIEGTLKKVIAPAPTSPPPPAAVAGWRKVFSTSSPPTSRLGRHNFALDIPAEFDANTDIPQGRGYGWIQIGKDGVATVTAKLSDGTDFSSSAPLGPKGEVILFRTLYGNLGSLTGNMKVDSDSAHSVSGSPTWRKPQRSADRLYPGGISTTSAPLTLSAVGGLYTPPTSGTLILGLPPIVPPATDEFIQLTFAEGGVANPQNPSERFLSISPIRVKPIATTVMPTSAPSSPVTATLTVTSSTGFFSGKVTFQNNGVLRPESYQGMIVRDGDGVQRG